MRQQMLKKLLRKPKKQRQKLKKKLKKKTNKMQRETGTRMRASFPVGMYLEKGISMTIFDERIEQLRKEMDSKKIDFTSYRQLMTILLNISVIFIK